MRNSVIHLFALVLVAASSQAQDWRTVPAQELIGMLDASAAQFKAMEHYEVHSTLAAYRSGTEEQPMETATSTVWKMGARSKAEHLGMLSMQDGHLRVTVDTDERLMMISDEQDQFELLTDEYRASVFHAASIGRIETPMGALYRARFGPGSDYEVLEFQFDRNGWLRKLDAYWGQAVSMVPENLVAARIKPRVSLEMSVPVRLSPTAMRIDLGDVFVWKNGKPIPAPRFAGYEVVDNRSQQ